MTESAIQVESTNSGVATVTLNRPSVHNAFDDDLIEQLSSVIQRLEGDPDLRVVILTGAGKSFSAGADLNWMRRMAKADEAQNRADSLKLAALMRTLAFMGKTTIAQVNGTALGGGVGLVACCDIAIASDSARFGLTETRLGLVPAVISPYVIGAIGARQASRLFQTAEMFSAQRASEIGLVHMTVPGDQLEASVQEEVHRIFQCGPQATRAAKSLVSAVSGRTLETQKKLDEATANLIASLRVSPEGQEGISAFLEKRAPAWLNNN